MRKYDEDEAFQAMLEEMNDSDEEDQQQSDLNTNTNAYPIKPTNDKHKISMVVADSKSLYDSGTDRARAGYKLSKLEQDIENFGFNEQQNIRQAQNEQIHITKHWLMKPCHISDRSSMKCFVERDRSSLGLQTTYRLYAESPEGQQPRFLLAARKKVSKQTSYYLISLERDPSDDRGSEYLVGKVRGNAIGSRYLITDSGLAPGKTTVPSILRKEMGAVSFEFDSGGPSRIEAWIPYVSASGVPLVWQPDDDSQGMEQKLEARNTDRLLALRNKIPKWDESHGGHVLNFQGRVTESSVKNFQLCCPALEDPEDVILQFGRVGKNKFTLDLKFPLSPFQAFGICVGCLDGKIADRKGYEYLRRMSTGFAHSNGAGDLTAEPKDNGTDGSMNGSSSIGGMLKETLPSGRYLRDKLIRTFK